MNRERIVREIARTLLVCAWADGVERGELEGEGPGPGGDWNDAAPRCWRNGTAPAVYVRRVSGTLEEVPDPDAEREALRIVHAFDEKANASEGFRALLVEVEREGWTRPECGAIEHAARAHAEATGGRGFAHQLAMQALGHGVGLSDDVRGGRTLPEWIGESVPSSDFSAADLDPERYPPTPTVVVFRRFPGGEVLALFPFVDAGHGLCSSYMHTGQHGGADYAGCVEETRPADVSEPDVAALARELEARGYRLDVRQRRPTRRGAR